MCDWWWTMLLLLPMPWLVCCCPFDVILIDYMRNNTWYHCWHNLAAVLKHLEHHAVCYDEYIMMMKPLPCCLWIFVGLHFDQLHEVTWVWMLNANAAVQTWCYIQINSHDHVVLLLMFMAMLDCLMLDVFAHVNGLCCLKMNVVMLSTMLQIDDEYMSMPCY